MSVRKTILINGKFLLASLEGMPRVAREICTCIDDLLAEERYRDLDVRLAVPRMVAEDLGYRRIKVERVGRLRGFLWEQVEFPVHARGRYCLNFTNTAPLVKRNGCVVVHDAQFISSRSSHDWKSRTLYNGVTPRVARHYRSIVTVSDYARRELLDFGVCARDDIHVIPNGVDHILRRGSDDAVLDRLGLVRDGYLLANSYIHAHKNVRILLQACALDPEGPPLVLFGGTTRAEYEVRDIAIPSRVIFAGRVGDQELVSLMRNARLFLFPSRTEGFGLPPLEAMMLGCATICAPAGAVPANCGDGAWYADVDSAEDWHAKIETLWHDDRLRAGLVEAGRARANRFVWLTAARAYLEVMLADLGAERQAARPVFGRPKMAQVIAPCEA